MSSLNPAEFAIHYYIHSKAGARLLSRSPVPYHQASPLFTYLRNKRLGSYISGGLVKRGGGGRSCNSANMVHWSKEYRQLYFAGVSISDVSLACGGNLINESHVRLHSTVTDDIFADKQRFPNVIAAGPSGQALMVQAMLALLTKFQWTSVSLICDLRSADPTENSGSLEICKTAQDTMSRRPWLYDINSMTIFVDSSNRSSFTKEILTARKHSKSMQIFR